MFNWVCDLAYGIVSVIAYFMGLLYQCFEVVAGLSTVTYQGDSSRTLLEVIFSDSMLNRAYWGMAIIGVALCFFFTIIAVIRKIFDSSDQVKNSLGEILTQCFKSVLLICSMSLIFNMTLYFSTSLLNAIQIAFFANTAEATTEKPKTFTDDEFAVMARVLNTIGNYSLNPSYNSRYNLNSCYNEIRGDLQVLAGKGTFNVQYETPDLLHNSSHYWQESLQKIVNAAPNLNADVPLDVYNENLAEAILDSMDQVKGNGDFKPLQSYAYTETSNTDMASLDRIVLLMGTFDAAYNADDNGDNASLTDPVRAPFYYGTMDVHSTDDMWVAFNLWDYSYFTGIFLSWVLLKNMIVIILNAIARLFNMALLYVIAPPFIALSPLDGGGKFKQWMTAFVVQCFAVFGTVIAMDMMVVFVPIIMSGELVIFEDTYINYFAKVVLVWGAYETVKKASSLITGILADNAGMQALHAGDMSQSAGRLRGAASKVAGKAVGAAATVAGGVTGVSGLKWMAQKSFENLKGEMQKRLPFGEKYKGLGSKDKGKKPSPEKTPPPENKPSPGNTPSPGGSQDAGSQKAPGGGQDAGAQGGSGGSQDAGAQKASGGEQDAGAQKDAGANNGSNDRGSGESQDADVQKAPGGEQDAGAQKDAGANNGSNDRGSGGSQDGGEQGGSGGGQDADAQKASGGEQDTGANNSSNANTGGTQPNRMAQSQGNSGAGNQNGAAARAKTPPPLRIRVRRVSKSEMEKINSDRNKK